MRWLLPLVSIAIFVMSLTQPAVSFEKICKDSNTRKVEIAGLYKQPLGVIDEMSGIEILALGGFGVLFAQIGAIGWLANPLYFYLLFQILKGKPARNLLMIICLVLGIISLPITNMTPFLADEGGACYFSASRPELGFWLWLFSMVLLIVPVLLKSNKYVRPTEQI